jgi:hypothetical protein
VEIDAAQCLYLAVIELFLQIFGFERVFRCGLNSRRNEFVYAVHIFFAMVLSAFGGGKVVGVHVIETNFSQRVSVV